MRSVAGTCAFVFCWRSGKVRERKAIGFPEKCGTFRITHQGWWGLDGLVAKWRSARRLQPVYQAVARKAAPHIVSPDPSELANGTEVELLARLEAWFDAVDAAVGAAEFRALLVTLELVSSENELNALAERFLSKREPAAAVREKAEFVLSRYFLLCAPPSFYNRDPSEDDVADVLEPFVGDYAPNAATQKTEIAALPGVIQKCETISNLMQERVLERAQAMRAALGADFYQTHNLVSVTRMNLVLYRKLNTVLSAECEALLKGLAALEDREEAEIELDTESGKCATVEQLRAEWDAWQVPADVEYSTPELLARIVKVRAALEDGLMPHLDRRMRQLAGSIEDLHGAVHHMQSQMNTMAQDLATLARMAQGQQRPAAVAVAAAPAQRPATAAAPAPAAPVATAEPAAPAPRPAVAVPGNGNGSNGSTSH